ncbi:hypothetical protein [Rhodothermus marinus]|uniref:DUF3311 domain-containing protein n=1 Tax=Rhodothermus marinus (strain ATCC 43812 / DSM 4252 / R-10) TaxID=518766 RepID=D0MIT2_RHOM4|nr:hypothetical protein [Rhodothermus marinus]ACY48390.1 conserved hypothetical protein [Rhodothermus marinus DSM 4252]BBM69818.1 hypothetical protein RmaAA213_16640 [Rhodothermus marinus]BBM72804.1 hypothetical protein RmaAA338_16690 [Rhodothermus marinus]
MTRARLVALFVLGLLLMNFPLLSLFSRERLLLGMPVLYVYLYGVWALVIGLLIWLMERRRTTPPEENP